MIWLPLLLSIVAAFADVLGGSFTLFKRLNEKQIVLTTAIGSGFLLGATLLDRLPDAMEELPESASVYIMIGYLLMLFLERYGLSHSHHSDHHHHEEAATLALDVTSQPFHTIMNQKSVFIAFIGLLIHTFMDGVILAGAFSESRTTGLLIFLAITMHKLPEGFSMATISLASGYSHKRAFGTSIGLAISTILGAGITLWIGAHEHYLIKAIMALGTGTFIFITTTNLIPAVKNSKDFKNVLAVIVSVFFFYISLLFIKHLGLG